MPTDRQSAEKCQHIGIIKYALRRFIAAKVAQFTRYDLKGDLQMEARAAWQEVLDAWRGIK